jgi:hypothetical protein
VVNPALHYHGLVDTDMMQAGNNTLGAFLEAQGFPVDNHEMVVLIANLVEAAMEHDSNQVVLGAYPFEHTESGCRLSFLVARDMDALHSDSQFAVKGAIDNIVKDGNVMQYYGVHEITLASVVGKKAFIAWLRGFYMKQTTHNANVSPLARLMIHGWSFRHLARMIHQTDIHDDGFFLQLKAAAFNCVIQENSDAFTDGDTFNLARIACESFVMELRELTC